jgi:phosphotransferase system enzyme I (PtsI)
VISLTGVAASPGVACAPARVVTPVGLDLPSGPVDDRTAETERLAAVLAGVADELEAQAAAAGDGELAEILQAQATMALDPELQARATALVVEQGRPAARAVTEVGDRFAASLEGSDNAYLAARAADVRDVSRMAAARLLGQPAETAPEPVPGPHVLVAGDVSPAEMARLDRAAVRGLATQAGSRSSHTAIVARALGIPAVVAVNGLLDAVREGVPVLVDGDAGTVLVDPDPQTIGARTAAPHAAGVPVRPLPAAVTTDGRRIELAVNVASPAELRAAQARGAAAVGLLRTELAALGAARPPSRAEQTAALREMARLLGQGRLVVRAFDFGSDKLPAFLPAAGREPNPALGVRGIRLLRRHPDLLRDQLAAVAAVGPPLAVMAPMLATVDEADWFRAACVEAGCVAAGVQIGAMVEVPAAVLIAAELAERLDFLSIGTNDLCQHLHAADRQVGALAGLQDPFAPALLRAVRLVVAGAAGRGRHVAVCGEAAADPLWAVVAAGLGVGELSVGAGDLAAVHAALEARSLASCRQAAEAALSATGAAEARRAAGEALH